MVVERNFEIGFRDVGKSNKLTNKALLGFLEDVAGKHSNIAGYGLNNIEKTGVTWVLLNWKVRIFSRPLYGETILAKTWGRDTSKFYTYRDFEVFDMNNNLVAIATSKWALLDANTMKLIKIPSEVITPYEIETKKVFNEEPEPCKLMLPNEISSTFDYIVQRKDIDINNHVHNVTYMDIAYEALPEPIYNSIDFNSFEIMYKKETKLGESIKCLYSKVDNSHYVVILDESEKSLHCIIKLDAN